DLPLVLLAPQVRAIDRVHKLRLDHQLVVAIGDSAEKHGANPELASNLLGVRSSQTLVSKHRASSHHSQLGELRQVVDQRLGYSIREVTGAQLARLIDKREDSDRIDRLPRPLPAHRSSLSFESKGR